MADFPGGVYSPRTKENKVGVEYDADKKSIGYAEDITKLDDEIVAVETFLSPKLLTLRPQINWNEIKKTGVPDQVQRGVYHGFSMPVYAANHEEIYLSHRVPYRWDEASDIRVKIRIVLAGGEDIGDKFKFQLSWEHAPCAVILPDTANDVEVETTILTGRNNAYDKYCVTFILDYDIDGVGNEIKAPELLGMRLRRIAASALEVSNEIIVLDWIVEYQRDKFGGAF